MSSEQAKKNVGEAAAALIKSGMTVGLGTGSTSSAFITALAARCVEGLNIKCVASSKASHALAQSLSIPLIDISTVNRLDITVDGADEIDDEKNMIKGGGGALMREKILAAMSDEMVVIVDEGKVVSRLGKFPLPVEILPFGLPATIQHLATLGYKGEIRGKANGEPFITENGNVIYDLHLPTRIEDPKRLYNTLLNIPGVLENGLFIGYAGRVLIGRFDGKVEIRQ